MDIDGRYLGAGPSGDSPLGIGEAELLIGDGRAVMRMATGREIVTLFDEPTSVFVELSGEEVAANFKRPEQAEGARSWRLGDSGIRLLLLPDPDEGPLDKPLMLVYGLPGERFIKAPAGLFTPSQILSGYHALAMAEFEKAARFGIGVPTLGNGGRPREVFTPLSISRWAVIGPDETYRSRRGLVRYGYGKIVIGLTLALKNQAHG